MPIRMAGPLSALTLLLLAGPAINCQEPITPPLKPAESGPSVSETLSFLTQNLPAWGSVSWMSTLFDVEAKNSGAPARMTQELDEIEAQPQQCSLRMTRKISDSRNSLRHLWWTYTYSPLGQQRRDWIQTNPYSWIEVNEDGTQASFQVTRTTTLHDVQGSLALKQDHSLTAFIPESRQSGTWGQWLLMQAAGGDSWAGLGKFVEDDRIGAAELLISLRSVQDVRTLPLEPFENAHCAQSGHPEVKESVGDPMPFSLQVNLVGNQHIYLVLIDQTSADRVAKALTHAVELCGGGSKEPF